MMPMVLSSSSSRLVLLSLFTFSLYQFLSPLHAQEKKRLTFEQIFRNVEPHLIKELPRIAGWVDDTHFLEVKKKEGDETAKVYSVDVKSGKETLYRDLAQYQSLVDSGLSVSNPVSENESYTRLIYVKDGNLYFLDTRKREFKRLTRSEGEEMNPLLSPDGNCVAFTRDNNLFSVDVNTGKEIQYTNDASDVVYNGWASWLYMEEILGRPTHYRAFWWSPDGKRLAFFRTDESKVPVFPLYNAEGIHGLVEHQRYPEAGDPNPEIRVGIVPVEGGSTTWADFNEHDDQYFGTPYWMPDGKNLVVQWMNRGQDTLELFMVDAATGTKKVVYIEHQPSWVDWIKTIHLFKNRKEFILKSDRDGWAHLYLYSIDGTLEAQITRGKWQVSDLLFVDELRRIAYFTARKEASTRTDLYKSGLDGEGLERLTFGDYSHSVNLSPQASYFITTYSNVSTPSRMALLTNGGKLVRELGDSKTAEFDRFALGKTELFRVNTPDSFALPVRWTLPVDFDSSTRYPVLIDVYGGPGSGTVFETWGGIRQQWWSNEGLIQMSMDHRGSGHFGKEGVALMYRHLGKWEMNDYIEVVKWLRKQPFIDSTRICITGASYGGYVTCMALTYGADYFTFGIASSSVTDWKLYDTHYVERYMDAPSENPEGYAGGSVMTYVPRYKGLLRIVHGTMDDNVHMQNAIQLVSALEDHNKHFELMIYPGGRHGWGGRKAVHSRNENYRFYYRYLLRKDFPEDLFTSRNH